jgi:mRNA interferase RelE/StbE
LLNHLHYAIILFVYTLILSKQADKVMRKLPHKLSTRIKSKLIAIAQNPYSQHNNVTRLKEQDGYRLRVGDWRIIYKIRNQELIIYVLRVAPRGEVYK